MKSAPMMRTVVSSDSAQRHRVLDRPRRPHDGAEAAAAPSIACPGEAVQGDPELVLKFLAAFRRGL
jgi:hypothetical protein